jgi:chemotaxis signal transduction protein
VKQGNVVVSVEAERFALALDQIREIARGCWPQRIPRAPFGCLGAICVRGISIPLVDLGVLVGARRPDRGTALETRLLAGHMVVLAGHPPTALLVDRVIEVNEARELPAGVVLLDGSTLLGPGRRALLARGTARAEERE